MCSCASDGISFCISTQKRWGRGGLVGGGACPQWLLCVSGLGELAELKNQKIKSMVPDLDDMTGGGDDENHVMNGS